MKKTYLILLSAYIFSFILNGQTIQNVPHEKVYIQTDKAVYITGELIWLNMICLTPEGKPFSFSKIGYIELLGDTISTAQAIIDIQEGSGSGSLMIPADLESGYYQLTGYTRNMENESSEIFFKKTIAIINPLLIEKDMQETEGASRQQATLTNASTYHNIKSETSKSVYSTRAQGVIKLTDIPKNISQLSISISGTSPLKVFGHIMLEDYINSPEIQIIKSSYDIQYTPEYEGHIILANKRSSFPKNSKAQPFIAFPGKDIKFFTGIESENQYEFITQNTSGFQEIILGDLAEQSTTKDLELASPFSQQHIFTPTKPLYADSSMIEYLQMRSVGLQVLYHFLRDSMNIYKEKIDHSNYIPYRSYLTEDYTRFSTLAEIVTEYIPLVRFRNSSGNRYASVYNQENEAFPLEASLVVLDGIPIADHNVIYNYQASHIKCINLYSGKYILGGQIYNGILSLQTYQHNFPDLNFGENLRLFDYKTASNEREFYMPDYSSNILATIPDFRHTLLWIPSLKPSSSTEQVPFFTSDIRGEFQVVIEGITTDGQPVYARTTFEVE